MRDQGPELSAKRQRFIEEYLIDLNGKQAAIRAGYTPASASVTASRLLANDNVKNEVARRQAHFSEKLCINTENVINELANIAFGNLGDFISIDRDGGLRLVKDAFLDREKTAALSNVVAEIKADGSQTIRLTAANKTAALMGLSRHLGLFDQKSRPSKVEDLAVPSDRERALAVLALLLKAQVAVNGDGQPASQMGDRST